MERGLGSIKSKGIGLRLKLSPVKIKALMALRLPIKRGVAERRVSIVVNE